LLEPYGLLFIEEPVPPEDPAALREVTSRSTTRIASGERLSSIYEVRPFLEARALGLLQVDLANCGGITGGKKIAALAESHYVGLAPHNPNGPLATAAAVHLLAAVPNCYLLEMVGSPDDLELHERMARPALRPRRGAIALPEAPGLGLELVPGCEVDLPYQAFEGWR
jgi:galactonate dehydratase